MSLSRGGYELSEIWARQLVEMDREQRKRQRRAFANPGDVQAQEAHKRALLHAGHHDEYMQPHIQSYVHARDAHEAAQNEISRKGNWAELREKVDKAKTEHLKQRANVHERAGETGKPAGVFLPHNEDEHTDADHWSRLAGLHNGTAESGSYASKTPNRVHFFDKPKDRDEFRHTVEKHVGDRYTVKSRDRDEHGHYFEGGPMANREEPHRVEIHQHKGGREFSRLIQRTKRDA